MGRDAGAEESNNDLPRKVALWTPGSLEEW